MSVPPGAEELSQHRAPQTSRMNSGSHPLKRSFSMAALTLTLRL